MKKKSGIIKKTKRTSIKIADHKDIVEKLYSAIWVCKIGNFNETEALTFINSGELGFHEQTEQEVIDNIRQPITITRTTYYKYKSILESPEYQIEQTFKLFRQEFVTEIIKRFKLFKSLEAKSFRALEQESDPYKKQLIINGIFKNSPFVTSLLDIIRHMIENKKLPFLKNPEIQKILDQKYSEITN